MNEQLKQLYLAKINDINKIERDLDYYDGPLLLNVHNDYLNSEYKIMFICQEPNGWNGYVSFDVDNGMSKYRKFDLFETGKYTTIWKYMYEFKNLLMPESVGEKNFLWNNLSKFCTWDGKTLSKEDFYEFTKNFNVLHSEVEITKPNIIIFFTGYNWDEKLKEQFNSEIQLNQLRDDLSTNELAQLKSNIFPKHTYRVAHPRSLQLCKKWHYMEIILEEIIKNR